MVSKPLSSKEATSKMDPNSPAVLAHLQIVQDVISRMAANTASCKTWCVTLVAATLVLIARLEESNYALIALVPTIAFLILDTYYLSLERGFRNSYSTFVKKLHAGELKGSNLYVIEPTGNEVFASMRSFSIWPFYGILAVLIVVVWQFVLG